MQMDTVRTTALHEVDLEVKYMGGSRIGMTWKVKTKNSPKLLACRRLICVD